MAAMDKQDLTLEELSSRTGVEARTLRSWVSEGLLAPPFKPGRGARYPASNADRALAIRALKDLHGLTLAEIGRRFLMANDEQIREWASSAGQTSAPPGSAREYLKMLRGRAAAAEAARPDRSAMSAMFIARSVQAADPAERPGPIYESRRSIAEHTSHPAAGATDRTRIEQLILALEGLLAAPAPRRATSTTWTRIGITADLELSVRGDLAPAERLLFEQLADQLRAILTGRTNV
jgi:DNA-binding transcriptional MerR regulator